MSQDQTSLAEVEYSFIAKLDNAKDLSQLLRAISIREVATVEINDMGIRVIAQEGKCVQAIAFVQRELFDSYALKEPTLSFDISLSIWLECLTMFGAMGGPVSTRLCYGGPGNPLVMFLEESGVVTDCKIRTLESEGVVNFDLSRDNVINVVILKSESIKEVWSELDISSEDMEVFISPNDPYFRLSTFGAAGTVEVSYSKESEFMESFQCKKEQRNSYKINLMKQCIKALNLSSKVAIRTDQLGLICFQFLIRTEEGTATFVEYYCTPNREDPQER
ncbi:cell cycle checkpoint protein RAD1 isoform X1 [Dermacentor andersoni]|uniref:cell cycle checkpoint protein RAD1 isoform X1 n=2 Tax=Dermacentor andersoni TaxID=34620 RepID=UPI002155EB3C|nr:cell cycle checkpoint protein RAD1-like isoform X1 [Dermacentor andersoni]